MLGLLGELKEAYKTESSLNLMSENKFWSFPKYVKLSKTKSIESHSKPKNPHTSLIIPSEEHKGQKNSKGFDIQYPDPNQFLIGFISECSQFNQMQINRINTLNTGHHVNIKKNNYVNSSESSTVQTSSVTTPKNRLVKPKRGKTSAINRNNKFNTSFDFK